MFKVFILSIIFKDIQLPLTIFKELSHWFRMKVMPAKKWVVNSVMIVVTVDIFRCLTGYKRLAYVACSDSGTISKDILENFSIK